MEQNTKPKLDAIDERIIELWRAGAIVRRIAETLSMQEPRVVERTNRLRALGVLPARQSAAEARLESALEQIECLRAEVARCQDRVSTLTGQLVQTTEALVALSLDFHDLLAFTKANHEIMTAQSAELVQLAEMAGRGKAQTDKMIPASLKLRMRNRINPGTHGVNVEEITAALMGDPPPGRSALDKKRSAA